MSGATASATKPQRDPATVNEASSRGMGSRLARWLLFTVIGSMVGGGLLAAGILLFGRFGEVEGKIVGTTLLLGLFSFLGLGSSLRLRRGRFVWLGILGMATAAVAFVLLVSGMWTEIDNETYAKATMSSVLLAGAAAFASVLMIIRPTAPPVEWTFRVTLGLMILVVAMGELLILWAPDVAEGDVFFRILGAAAILTALGGIVTPILNWMVRRRPDLAKEAAR